MSDPHTKAGPANHASNDLDAPTPPGGPLRQDAPDVDEVPGRPDDRDYDPLQDLDVTSSTQENAGSSLDQPSDDSGSEQ